MESARIRCIPFLDLVSKAYASGSNVSTLADQPRTTRKIRWNGKTRQNKTQTTNISLKPSKMLECVAVIKGDGT